MSKKNKKKQRHAHEREMNEMELRAQTQSATMKKMRNFDICKNNNLAPLSARKMLKSTFCTLNV